MALANVNVYPKTDADAVMQASSSSTGEVVPMNGPCVPPPGVEMRGQAESPALGGVPLGPES